MKPINEVFIPNTFTPNDDQTNDVLFVRAVNAKTVELHIFNRWGEEIFVTKKKSEGWDGTFQGEKMVPQVVVYWAEVEFNDGEKKSLEGNITIVH